MPSISVRLKPGVDTVKTPALNEAGIVSSNMIRFREGLVEKRGGWTKFYSGNLGYTGRAVLPFLGVDSTQYVVVAGVNGSSSAVSVITGGVLQDITPRLARTAPTSAFSTTSGSNVVTIVDPSYSPNIDDLLFIVNPVAVGGVVFNSITPFTINSIVNSTTFTVKAASNATSTVSNGGTFVQLSTTAGSAVVAVNLANIGAVVGGTFPVVSTTIGGLTLSGTYVVETVTDASNFTIRASSVASSTASAAMAGGVNNFLYAANAKIGVAQGGSAARAADWSLAAFGTSLVACGTGLIYTWSKTTPFQTAQIIKNAPTSNTGIIVADAQQMIIAYGAGGDPNVIAWCDAGNFNIWTASGTNQAGSYRIPTGSGVVGACVGPTQNILWTDIDIWTMQYIGYPLVWGFNKIAAGCGLVAQFAWAKLGENIYWMSQKGFWMLGPNGVQPVPCPIWDTVFANISTANVSKIRGASSSQFGEAMWFYPSKAGSGENDTYVCLNTVEGTWDYGSMARSAWADQSIAGGPLGTDPAGNLYQHETSPDGNGSAISASFTTGWFLVDEGEEFSFIDWIRPDINFPTGAGTVQISIQTANYTTDTPIVSGPYNITSATQYINTRCRGRYVALTFSSSDVGSFWRIGRVQMRIAKSGKR